MAIETRVHNVWVRFNDCIHLYLRLYKKLAKSYLYRNLTRTMSC